MIICQGLAAVYLLTVAVGANFGAGQFARARKIAWVGAGVTFAVSATIGITVSWQISAFFIGVAAGLAVIGIGLALCMRSAAWQPEHRR